MVQRKRQTQLFSTIRQDVPSTCGVYLFYDGDGNVIYVGKSGNLKKRMLSYSRKRQDRVDSRIREMIYRIEGFSFYTTDTELLALLLEDNLIKEYLPRYNVRQKEYSEYQYLILVGASPALKMIADPKDLEEKDVFGPFRDAYFVKDLLSMLRRHFRQRTDFNPIETGWDCELNCTGIVHLVRDFLNGEERTIAQKIRSAMARAAAALEFERAARLRDELAFCENFCRRQRFIRKFRTKHLKIKESDCTVYGFAKGRLTADGWMGESARTAEKISEYKDPSRQNDPRFVLDRGNIVYNWIRRQGDHCEFTFHDVGN